MSKIKKGDMAARALGAAAATPGITERFAHARELASTSPVLHQGAEVQTLPNLETTKAQFLNPQGIAGDYLEEVPLSLIDPNPYNARHVYRPARVSELAASIGAHGQDTPGIATLRNGRYVLVAGHYRYKALRLLNNRPMLLLIRKDLTDQQMYQMSFRENEEREDQSALDNALAWKSLLANGTYSTENELAEVTGYSVPNINKTLAMLRLDESVLAINREEPTMFKFSVVYELVLFGEVAKAERLEDTLALARGILAGEVTRKMVQIARDQLSKGSPARKQKETARTYKINTTSKDTGSLKTWDSGKITLDVIVADSTERQELIAYLQNRFGLSD